MFDFLKNNIFYEFNDQVMGIVRRTSEKFGYDLTPNIEKTNRFIFSENLRNYISSPFFKTENIYLGYNLVLIINILINLICSYLMFKDILIKSKKATQLKEKTEKQKISIFNKILIFTFAVLFTFSLYNIYRYISFTMNLTVTFIFPLTFLLLYKSKSFFKIKEAILFTIFNVFSFQIGFYYGFFCTTITILFLLIKILISKNKIITKLINLAIFCILGGIINLLIFYPIIKANILVKKQPIKYIEQTILIPKKENIKTEENNYFIETNTGYKVKRPIEDFYNFSFRPWYFFIPPNSSTYFGKFSNNAYERIEASKYYLADDYVDAEMGGSYMGWHILIIYFISILLTLKYYFKKYLSKGKIEKEKIYLNNIKFKYIYLNRKYIMITFLILIIILCISHPPAFTIKGITIYTPSYLMFLITSSFRVLTRWAVVIFLIMLIGNFIFLLDIFNITKNKFKDKKNIAKLLNFIILIFFIITSYIVFAIKVPKVNLKKDIPEYIKVLNQIEIIDYAEIDKKVKEEKTLKEVNKKEKQFKKLVIYPKHDFENLFWLTQMKDTILLNSKDNKDIKDILKKEKQNNSLENVYFIIKKKDIDKNKEVLEQLNKEYLINLLEKKEYNIYKVDIKEKNYFKKI